MPFCVLIYIIQKSQQLIIPCVYGFLSICRFAAGMAMLFRGANANDSCHWCHYLSCVPTARWNCTN
jgi:hypothetical protein